VKNNNFLTIKNYNKITKPNQKLNLFIIRKKGMKQKLLKIY